MNDKGERSASEKINSSQSTDNESTQEETKDNMLKGNSAKQELFNLEMGFSLVIEAIINAKVPVIGHNCMYDWLYLYN